MAAHQAPPSLGSSRQERWSGFVRHQYIPNRSEVSGAGGRWEGGSECSGSPWGRAGKWFLFGGFSVSFSCLASEYRRWKLCPHPPQPPILCPKPQRGQDNRARHCYFPHEEHELYYLPWGPRPAQHWMTLLPKTVIRNQGARQGHTRWPPKPQDVSNNCCHLSEQQNK